MKFYHAVSLTYSIPILRTSSLWTYEVPISVNNSTSSSSIPQLEGWGSNFRVWNYACNFVSIGDLAFDHVQTFDRIPFQDCRIEDHPFQWYDEVSRKIFFHRKKLK